MAFASFFPRLQLPLSFLVIILPVYQGVLWSPASNVLFSGSKSYLMYTDSVSAGMNRAIEECKYQFRWDRWNCPEASLSSPNQNTREMSFVHSIASAGVMYSLTKNCSQGAFDKCSCDDSHIGEPGGEGWTWGGCSDNVRFGERMSKLFVDAAEKSQGGDSVMNLHNNEAGRKAVKQTLQKTCKCHGVSGSCSLQTCWNQLANFRVVGDQLKKKYLDAIRVDFVSGRLIEGNRAEDGVDDEISASLNKRDLVYLQRSPDYCRPNETIGTTGTDGRECVMSSNAEAAGETSRWAKRSCTRLCRGCDMGIKRTQVVVTSSCNCNFVWCCSVKCDTCRRVVTRYTCQRIGR
uniref:Protein Wnt n=1 Tax=Eucidaris tribuloides TaxID=7632 RepID=A0A346HVI1_EUCTR|nr:wingless-type secreted protein 8 [Eucidaris tribuloides]